MRILYVITKSNFGGAQRYVFELAVAMRDHGHTVAVATGGNGELVEKLTAAGIAVLPLIDLERDINLTKEWRSFWALKELIGSWKPDVVHVNSSKAGALGALASRLSLVPRIIFTAHGWAFLESRSLLWKSLVYGASYITTLLSHTVIVVSENDLRHAPMFFLKGRCVVIPTAVPAFELTPRESARTSLFTSEEIEAHTHDVWVVSIAELTPNKNLTKSITAVAEFNRSHRQQIFYSIIGSGELRETLSALIREEGAEGTIKLLGHIPDARTTLRAFDILILPSKKEGMPYAILEAGIAELPVIASRVGGIPEVIEDDVTGILIDPENHISITKALKALIHDAEFRTKVAANLHTRVRAKYGLKSMIENTERLYESSREVK